MRADGPGERTLQLLPSSGTARAALLRALVNNRKWVLVDDGAQQQPEPKSATQRCWRRQLLFTFYLSWPSVGATTAALAHPTTPLVQARCTLTIVHSHNSIT